MKDRIQRGRMKRAAGVALPPRRAHEPGCRGAEGGAAIRASHPVARSGPAAPAPPDLRWEGRRDRRKADCRQRRDGGPLSESVVRRSGTIATGCIDANRAGGAVSRERHRRTAAPGAPGEERRDGGIYPAPLDRSSVVLRLAPGELKPVCEDHSRAGLVRPLGFETPDLLPRARRPASPRLDDALCRCPGGKHRGGRRGGRAGDARDRNGPWRAGGAGVGEGGAAPSRRRGRWPE